MDQISHYASKLAYEIDAADLYAAQQEGQHLVVIDARNAQAYAAEHIPGALSAPFNQFADGGGGLTKLKSDDEIKAVFAGAGVKPGDTKCRGYVGHQGFTLAPSVGATCGVTSVVGAALSGTLSCGGGGGGGPHLPTPFSLLRRPGSSKPRA